jgi:hypothetical protein
MVNEFALSFVSVRGRERSSTLVGDVLRRR